MPKAKTAARYAGFSKSSFKSTDCAQTEARDTNPPVLMTIFHQRQAEAKGRPSREHVITGSRQWRAG